MTQSTKIKKIAILGGGPAALAAAFELTSVPNWQEKYEITLYQVGWRLGGKCATGRGPNARIEEHGWHAWFGCYENAFNLMRRCYDELNRSPDAPFAQCFDAFLKRNTTVAEENFNGEWQHIPMAVPTNDQVPGDDTNLSIWDYIDTAMDTVFKSFLMVDVAKTATNFPVSFFSAWWEQIIGKVKAELIQIGLNVVKHSAQITHHTLKLMGKPGADRQRKLKGLLWIIDQYRRWLYHRIHSEGCQDFDVYNRWAFSDFVCANLRGIIDDNIVARGFNAINDLDYTQWLQQHGLQISADYWQIRGAYDSVFAYEGGTKPNLAAGTGLYLLLRQLFTYKGSPLWEMRSGMGETVITPFYLVLRRRGVNFKFFHRITNLGLAEDQNTIATININRQVALKKEVYEPLIDVKGLLCWPAEPLYDQIIDGELLKTEHVNLESFWCKVQTETLTLQRGIDFDDIILGIPIGVLPFICPELIAARQEWHDMITHVQTVQTQGVQLWFNSTTQELGCPHTSPIFTSYAEPFNVWADVSHLIAWENWDTDQEPHALFYLIGPMPTEQAIVPVGDSSFPSQQQENLYKAVVQYLEQHTPYLFPAFKWDVLAAPQRVEGVARLKHQYLRANYEPSDRYVLSVAGSSKYRLKTDQSGFSNLYLVGDWIDTGINVGCVEVAILSGRQASHAICGYPEMHNPVN